MKPNNNRPRGVRTRSARPINYRILACFSLLFFFFFVTHRRAFKTGCLLRAAAPRGLFFFSHREKNDVRSVLRYLIMSSNMFGTPPPLKTNE